LACIGPSSTKTFRSADWPPGISASADQTDHAMLAIDLDPETEQRLTRLANETGQSKVSVVLEAIREHLDDIEDVQIAKEILPNPGRLYTAEEAKRDLGLLK
jgi:RHH-type rel operon transcriptional repressor/antitoxin RelB